MELGKKTNCPKCQKIVYPQSQGDGSWKCNNCHYILKKASDAVGGDE